MKDNTYETEDQAMNGYKDSKDRIIECENAIKEQKYQTALSYYNSYWYDEAITILNELGSYKDSASYLQKATKKNVKVGDIIKFGKYEQDNDQTNGQEEIEWIVLDKSGDHVLIISSKVLDGQHYNNIEESVTWETCSLRTWLNDTFLTTAFNTKEQTMLLSTNVSADKNPSYSTNPGNATTDKVFLLSITEAKKYFTSDSARQCPVTAYAKAQKAAHNIYGDGTWWLRTPGMNQECVAYVDLGGQFSNGSVCPKYPVYRGGKTVWEDGYEGVRPALWIDLNS